MVTSIYLKGDGAVRLTDFALARSLLPGQVATSVPRPQGDAYYGAPEALLGEPMDPQLRIGIAPRRDRLASDLEGDKPTP
jgi:hypothetical protein